MIELQSRVLCGDRSGPRLLITGGVHGDEFEPMAAIRRLFERIAPLAPRELRGRLSLIPVVNEAAFLLGTRAAEDGLDLARTCPGREDGSVTERTAFALAAAIRDSDFYIDLHTGGTRLTVWPLAGYMLHPDTSVLELQRRMARAFNLPLVWGSDAKLEGRSLSVARDARVPAIYCEYLGGGGCSEEGVAAYVDGCLNVMRELGMLDRPIPESNLCYIVEETRPGAGHMQICNPSPATGFFEPAVCLGNCVRIGDLLGTVTDPLGDNAVDVRASQAGVVIVLHTFRTVRAGDSLAVIIDLDSRVA
ncbi:MAG: succinylglutamate desuccinylase [Planctomycetes bacterium]|nr:succinylglutamate desuccinylase [Planctomycetota bacterium]